MEITMYKKMAYSGVGISILGILGIVIMPSVFGLICSVFMMVWGAYIANNALKATKVSQGTMI